MKCNKDEVTNVGINLKAGTAEEIMAKYDREFAFRKFQGPWARIITIICVIWSLGQLYTAAFGIFPSTLQRAPHVGFALVLIFLLYPAMRKSKSIKIPWYDYILAILSALVSLYHVIFYEDLINRAGNFNDMDMWISVIAVLLIIEATRRIAGPVITSLGVVFLLYAYFGPEFSGFLAHPGFTVKRIATFQWLSTEGILGIPIDVSSTFIFLFMLFAAFLKKTGIGDWMTNVAVGLTGSATGGPAKAAVVASATQGTISGSSVANTVGTGSVTIPLMKSIGYRPEFAGAVEAAASTGGQLMPPIMGAAAFVMTEFLNIPYYKIALAAAIPALLYFTGIFITVHLEAKKTGLKGLPREQLPDWKHLLKTKWFLSLPLFGIIVMLVKGFTPMLAALIGILMIIAVAMILPETRLNLEDLVQGLEDGARSALPVVTACATAGIIVGVITLSGLGLKMAGGIVGLAGGNVYLTLLYTMIGSLILGMGVPTTANYIIQATVSAPALVQVGINPLAAHLFVFYFGIVADITPPVALAAFAGSGIARSDPFRTGFEAFKLGFAAYLVPYIFALSPVLILVNVTPLAITKALITALIGMFGIGASTTGFFVTRCYWWERLLLFPAGVCLIDPGSFTDTIGLVIIVVIYGLQKLRSRSPKRPYVNT
ncbi:TRAP transporter fused permease subunit [Thermanaerosceptrum fracticalcis]|uniref:TRAP transporter fused permease subunit n=1 Tax=Thermanaerosceptrum fracticalcis TaxID=1712410 RepID=A0A7G6E2K4_THEFR|nr:TRAP transporter permease [Thermanaerosceptrum fracticalcis]QNB46308.1 TRAP transporter fused permease subunit [Thermanaerosceptrum fracticalcis]